jgi:hypothetical protein
MTSDPDLDSHGKYMQRGIAGKNTRQGRNGTNFDKDDAGRVYWLASPPPRIPATLTTFAASTVPEPRTAAAACYRTGRFRVVVLQCQQQW